MCFFIVLFFRDLLDVKCVKISGEDVGDSDIEIDVVNEDF